MKPIPHHQSQHIVQGRTPLDRQSELVDYVFSQKLTMGPRTMRFRINTAEKPKRRWLI